MNMKSVMAIVIGSVVLLGIVGGVIIFSEQRSDTQLAAAFSHTVGAPEDVEPTTPETKQVSEGWRSYENAAFRFGLLFPQEMQAHEYKEAGGALSVVFENTQNGEGFQIYVTPYAETQITQERFRLDVSSGVMQEPVDVMIAGVRGTMFWSRNSVMGETREVWFINNGFLYEVVTYKHLDNWLGTIMQTWKFL